VSPTNKEVVVPAGPNGKEPVRKIRVETSRTVRKKMTREKRALYKEYQSSLSRKKKKKKERMRRYFRKARAKNRCARGELVKTWL